MNRLLKYLVLLSVVAVAIIGDGYSACVGDSSVAWSECGSEGAYCFTQASSTVVDIEQTNLVVVPNVLRIPTIAKRQSNAHKSNYEYTQSGRVVNAGVCNIIYRESLIKSSRFIKPDRWFISLGKLII